MDSTYLLGNGVTFMQYLASVAFLISLSKTLIWNKIVIPVSNSLNLPELVVNELNKNISQFFYQIPFFYSNYHCFMSRFQKLLNKDPDNFIKILISIVFY